jgi:geranylgeranyl diphosphate synthase, type I
VFVELYSRYAADIDQTMRDVVGTFVDAPTDLNTMVSYPLGWVDAESQPYTKTTGKRVRPILLLACLEAADGDWKQGLPAAAAVEILHNFSLVHDDIQDNSDMRHGRETVWQVWGQPLAINAGDAMFALSYRAIEQLSTVGVPAKTVLKVFEVYNSTVLELTRGQHLDMFFESQTSVGVEDYLSMVSGKTAALLAGTAQIGALIARQPMEITEQYAAFGLNLGIAFQIRDDILGIWGEEEKTGKSAATDIIARKKSVPILYGLEQSEMLQTLYRKTVPLTADEVQAAVAALDQTNAREKTLEQERTYYNKAVAALNAASPTVEGRIALMSLVDGLFKRSY